jgi:two-component system, NtrC family, response regulator AtoC
VFDDIMKVAGSMSTTVLITGESGTGKELAAKAIHFLSERRERPLMTVNCSALAESLVESELFGHEKGAFTDAHAMRPGVFELADTGTILLDEIGDVSPKLQVQLLRVIEEKTFRRIGSTKEIKVDVRIIASTNRPLGTLVREERFRADLYYRLNVANIAMPPLRDRGDDLLLLAEYFLHEFNTRFHKHFRGFHEEALAGLFRYQWPGNIRELRNTVERAVLLHEGDFVLHQHLELPLHPAEAEAKARASGNAEGVLPSLFDVEKQALLNALERAGNNQSQAARLLNISRDTLRYRIKKYKLKDH